MYRATKTFTGQVKMKKGEVRDLKDKATIKDLLRAGYIEEVKPAAKPKKGDAKDGING